MPSRDSSGKLSLAAGRRKTGALGQRSLPALRAGDLREWGAVSRCRLMKDLRRLKDMRTHLFRGVCAVAVVLTLTASAFAQSVVRGKVQDAQGKPVENATIVFEAEGTNRKMQTNTDKKGEFLQVGLQSGPYTVTASKDGVGTASNNPQNFTLAPAGAAVTAADKAAAQKMQALAGEASAALRAGNNDEAIAKF